MNHLIVIPIIFSIFISIPVTISILLLENSTYAVINVGAPDPRMISPYTKYEGTPQIVIKNDGNIYQGQLRIFNLVTGDVNSNMPAINSNSSVSSVLPNYTVNVSQNEKIQLLIKGNPLPELQPSSLSSTIYFKNGTGFKVLSLDDNSKKDVFIVDLPVGEYYMLATATWLPNPDNYLTTSGYVIYSFRLNVE
ncbi:MAG TPA: hypothetical protein VFG45_07625 [Candidatus Nitrosocosmicus sp.]|nr:hypothetical protein [Candidatus Nitrosocosmicus sp.]